MEDNYSVIWKVHNKQSGAWATQVAWSGPDVREAKSKYHSEFGRLSGSEDFDFVMCLLTSAWGNTQADFIDDSEDATVVAGWPASGNESNSGGIVAASVVRIDGEPLEGEFLEDASENGLDVPISEPPSTED